MSGSTLGKDSGVQMNPFLTVISVVKDNGEPRIDHAEKDSPNNPGEL